MSNIVKTILFLLVVGFAWTAEVTFADQRPVFEIMSPLVFEDQIVQLRGTFDPQNSSQDSFEQPLTWFEFGTDPADLAFETPRNKQFLFGDKQITQGITRLQPDTTYYVQTAIKFDGTTEKGEIVSFNSSDVTPMNVTNALGQNANTADANQEQAISGVNISGIGTNQPVSTIDTSVRGLNVLGSDLDLISPLRYLPQSKEKKSLKERERLVALKEKAFLEAEANARLPRTGLARSDFKESATNDDENGEIIIAAKTKKIKRSGGAIGTASVFNTGGGVGSGNTNYMTLLLFVVMLVAAVLLSRMMFGSKSKRQRYAYAPRRSSSPNYQKPQVTRFPQKRKSIIRKRYMQMNNNPAAYPRFNQMNPVNV